MTPGAGPTTTPTPTTRTEPVPGANDGASGVAVLLELARALDKTKLENEVWLVFFDAEDNGRLDGWQFIAGSSYFAQQLTEKPAAVIIADMIGDADQQIYKEQNSTPWLVEQVWGIAKELGYEGYFLPTAKYSMLDDHTPFLRKGIPAVDLIDFDYPYWHTTEDTADKVSAASLARVGRVLETAARRGRASSLRGARTRREKLHIALSRCRCMCLPPSTPRSRRCRHRAST